MCRVYEHRERGPYVRLCYATGYPGAHLPVRLLPHHMRVGGYHHVRVSGLSPDAHLHVAVQVPHKPRRRSK